jgi:hypothetical protein
MAGDVAAQNGKHVAHVLANIFEAAKYLYWNGDSIARTENDLTIFAVGPEVKRPGAGVNDEHFRCFVAVLRIDTAGRLSCAADVEAVWFLYMYVLVRILGDTRADDSEIFFFLAPGSSGVNERSRTGFEVVIADELISENVVERLIGRRSLVHVIQFLLSALLLE